MADDTPGRDWTMGSKISEQSLIPETRDTILNDTIDYRYGQLFCPGCGERLVDLESRNINHVFDYCTHYDYKGTYKRNIDIRCEGVRYTIEITPKL